MNINILTAFFKWCTIINVGLFLFSALMILAIPDFIYNMHGHWFNIPREAFDIVLYGFLGLYKILLIVFNIVPLLALLIIGKKSHHTHPAT